MRKEIPIQAIRSRPRFKVKTMMNREEFNQKLESHFVLKNKVLGGFISTDYSVIRIRKNKEKYWSPQLQIRTEEDEDQPNLTVIRGLFGPKPAVWTFFLFMYGLGATIVLILGMYGYVQLTLGNNAPWLWAIPVGFGLILGTYIATKIGQQIAKQHMRILRSFVETVLVEENIIELNEAIPQSV